MLPYLCAPHPRSDIHKGTRQAIVTLCLVPFYRLCIYSPICRNAGDACHAGYPAAPIPLTFISFHPPLFLILRLLCRSEPLLFSRDKSEQFISPCKKLYLRSTVKFHTDLHLPAPPICRKTGDAYPVRLWLIGDIAFP